MYEIVGMKRRGGLICAWDLITLIKACSSRFWRTPPLTPVPSCSKIRHTTAVN